MRQFSLFVQPVLPRYFFDLRNIVRGRRIESGYWGLVPRPDRQRNVNPTLCMFWPAVERNIDRVRRRCLRARSTPPSETFGPITLEGGNILQVPSDDDVVPAEQQCVLSPSPPFGLVGSEFELEGADSNGQTPKRPGVDLDSPSLLRARTTPREAKELGAWAAKEFGHGEFRAQHSFVGWNRVRTIGIVVGDLNHGTRSPVLGWPAYDARLGVDGPGPLSERRISDSANFRNLQPNHPFNRKRRTDPSSVASVDVGATAVASI